jgi:hypothetical protein
LCQEVQNRCINAAGIQSNHIYEQCDGYPQDHTSCLTVIGKHGANIKRHHY